MSELKSGIDTSSIDPTVRLEDDLFRHFNGKWLKESVIPEDRATDGAFIQIKANEVLETPIQIINIGTGTNTIAATRNVIVADKNSKASILISYFSENANETFTNAITELIVKENAHLSIDKLQLENNTSYQVSTEQIHQDKNSTFTINTITLNGALVRNNLNILVDGTNCESNLNGVYILKGQQHVDNHTMVDHRVPHCNSNESYKGVMYDKSTAVFNGKVFVRKDAQKTNAFQNNANVLLSNDATVNSKPELEIYADDVKCSHGSTTGQLDEEAVFYLRARGISENSARQLIVSAFMNDIIEKIESEELKEFIFTKIREEFNWE
jgi:Fe-S cluster assembly protein SufD